MFVGVVDESETAVGFPDVLYLCIASKRQNHVQVDVFLVREEGGYWVVGVHQNRRVNEITCGRESSCPSPFLILPRARFR